MKPIYTRECNHGSHDLCPGKTYDGHVCKCNCHVPGRLIIDELSTLTKEQIDYLIERASKKEK